MKKINGTANKDYSKEYFLKSTAKKTWAGMKESNSEILRARIESTKWMLKIMCPKHKICLSLGCGWGRFMKKYLKRKAIRVIGVDINKENLLKCLVLNADLMLCDIDSLPIRDNTVDVTECAATTEHLSYPENVVKEAHRVIKEKHGVVIITWIHFKLSNMLFDRRMKYRCVLALRDVVFSVFPEYMKKPLKKFPGFKDVGLFRNKGFSVPVILRFYKDARVGFIRCKYSKRENMIIIASRI